MEGRYIVVSGLVYDTKRKRIVYDWRDDFKSSKTPVQKTYAFGKKIRRNPTKKHKFPQSVIMGWCSTMDCHITNSKRVACKLANVI